MAVTTDQDITGVMLQSGATVDSPTFTTTANFPDGTNSVPSIAWASDADGTGTGFYRRAANVVTLAANGAGQIEFASNRITANDTVAIGWGTTTATSDTSIARASANSVIFGAGTTATTTARTELNKAVASISNAVATDVLTITVPNAAHSASIMIRVTGSLGGSGAIGANEATASNTYVVSLTRTSGVNATAAISSAFGAAATAVAGAATVTCTAAVSAVSGAVGATNTFTVQVTISRGSGSSTNHTCLVFAQLMNANSSGITIS